VSTSLNGVLPDLVEAWRYLDQVVHASGLRGSLTSTVRTKAEQQRLYDRYVAGRAQFPAAPPGQSAHEFGYAVDYKVTPYAYQPDVGDYWVQMGGVWHASDAVHFEYPGFVAPPPEPGFWFNLIAGLPIAFWPTMLFDLLGIPSVARKDVDPAQEAYLRSLVKGL